MLLIIWLVHFECEIDEEEKIEGEMKFDYRRRRGMEELLMVGRSATGGGGAGVPRILGRGSIIRRGSNRHMMMPGGWM